MHQSVAVGLEAAAMLLSLLVSWQDWRTRSVTWLLFPILGMVLLGHRWLTGSPAEMGWSLILNWTALGLLLLLLRLYVRLRFYQVALRLQDCLGSGDVMFWFVVASYFSPVAFWIYFLLSSLLALISFGVLRWARLAGPDQRVPLAGLQAVGLVLLLGYAWINPAWNIAMVENQLFAWATAW